MEALSKGPNGRSGVAPSRAGGEPVAWIKVKLGGTTEIVVSTDERDHAR
jgi:hypothetical protein